MILGVVSFMAFVDIRKKKMITRIQKFPTWKEIIKDYVNAIEEEKTMYKELYQELKKKKSKITSIKIGRKEFKV